MSRIPLTTSLDRLAYAAQQLPPGQRRRTSPDLGGLPVRPTAPANVDGHSIQYVFCWSPEPRSLLPSQFAGSSTARRTAPASLPSRKRLPARPWWLSWLTARHAGTHRRGWRRRPHPRRHHLLSLLSVVLSLLLLSSYLPPPFVSVVFNPSDPVSDNEPSS